MQKTLLRFLAAALSVFGADVAGKWKATAEGPNGAMERTFDLKVEGDKLTGETVSSFAGKSQILEGKVNGDQITFKINVNFGGNEMQVAYKGKVVSKDEMKLTAEVGENTIEWAAKRQ